MNMRYLLIITCIMILAVSGCTHSDLNQSINSSYSDNSTSKPTQTPTVADNPTNLTNPQPGTLTGQNVEVSGKCYKVVDGDTIDVEGVGRIRFVGVNTPERGESGYQTAKDYVTSMCLGKTVGLDIDDKKNKDKYSRTLAVVYVDGVNLNQELLKKGYAEVMYIPPSEFSPYSWL
ncbi:MAG: thermonuclease family protein [Methanobacteriaceae archaeon]|nr:thermonuclease family protein [Methanobacteriaceae archaeon]